jgi:uncharacterized protein (DUF1800 family)
MTKFVDDAWAPFEPTANDPWDLRKVARLHRAAGFGATWSELRRDLAAGPAESVGRFLDPAEPSEGERATREALLAGALARADVKRLRAYWLYRMLFGGDPLRERLTLFWHGHFATSIVKVGSASAMSAQVETLREHALGGFAELLEAITADPAMLIWLDGGTSRRDRPNENYAREFLELFTMGKGTYSEADVREAARAFTGWTSAGRDGSFQDSRPKFVFEDDARDDGPKTFLGETGDWKARDVVRIVLERPETARRLALKLYRAFVADAPEPDPELIEPLADALRSGGYSIRRTIEIMLKSRHFYAKETDRRRVKSPVEYTVGLLRILEIPRPKVSLPAAASACARQGQELFAPPNVGGWDGGTSWINGGTLLERLNWATDVVWGNPEYGVAPYDPIAWAEAHGFKPTEAAGRFIDLVLQDAPTPEARSLVLDPGRDGTADGLRKSLQRLLHCPEFQLA